MRLKGGDPTLLGRMEPELSAARELGLGCEVVPGVSAHAASAAALGCELATPEAPLLLAEARPRSRTPPAARARSRSTAPAAIRGALQRILLERGLPASTPCVVAIEVSRRDETLVPCTLGELAETLARPRRRRA